MAQLTKAQLAAQNTSSFPNNNTKAITPAIHRTFNGNQIDSLAGQKVDITKADLQTLIDGSNVEIGTQYRITNADAGVVWVWGIDANVISTNAVLEGTQGAGTTTGQWGKYVLSTDTFTGNYVTISKADFDALVADSGLTVGARYRVQNAYTFDAYGAKDIIVLADTVNTIETTTYVPFGDILVPYTTDFAFNPGNFLACYVTMALTGTQALAYGGYNWKFNAGLPIYLTDGSLYFEAQIQGGDNSAIIFQNAKALDSSGTDWTAGTFGTYDPNTDTFTPYNGTYTPALSDTDFTVTQVNYVQNGKYVTVTGLLAYSGASTAKVTVNASLPIPSAFAGIRDAWGQVTGRSGTAAFNQGFINSNPFGGLDIICTDPATFNEISFTATYIII